jgi:tight adherence protein C
VAAFLAPDSASRRLNPTATRAARPAAAGATLRRSGTAWQRLITQPFQKKEKPAAKPGADRTSVELKLIQAGYDSPLAVQTYYAIRLILAVALPVFALIFTPIFIGNVGATKLIFLACVAAGIGALAPVIWVSHRTSARQLRITEGLPEILDLLLVCTEAGLGIDTALDRVGEETAKSQPILSVELRIISLQLRAGRQRQDAMRSFADRTGVEEVRALVNLLIQADNFGTSIGHTLRVFAEDLRNRRLLKAEEAANKVTVKLSMVLVACFLPALLIAIMAPIVYQAIKIFPHFE